MTIFNRGKREKLLPLPFEVEHLYGNRDPELPADDERGPDGELLRPDGSPRGLEQLVGRTWDVALTSAIAPSATPCTSHGLRSRGGAAVRNTVVSPMYIITMVPARGAQRRPRCEMAYRRADELAAWDLAAPGPPR